MLQLPKEFEPYRTQFEASAIEYIRVMATPMAEEELSLTQSKFGGYPYMPTGFKYPTTSEGEMMALLAQINFAEVPPFPDFPDQGILQFFVLGDDSVGMEYEYEQTIPVVPLYYRVIYHPIIEAIPPGTPRAFTDIPVISATESQIMEQACALSFKVAIDYPPLGEPALKALMAGTDFFEMYDNITPHQEKSRVFHEYREKMNQAGYYYHKLGGYANSVQDDPRHDFESIAHHQQLLQMSSGYELLIGDCGVAHFFIDPVDLKARDFSKVAYYWSCY